MKNLNRTTGLILGLLALIPFFKETAQAQVSAPQFNQCVVDVETMRSHKNQIGEGLAATARVTRPAVYVLDARMGFSGPTSDTAYIFDGVEFNRQNKKWEPYYKEVKVLQGAIGSPRQLIVPFLENLSTLLKETDLNEEEVRGVVEQVKTLLVGKGFDAANLPKIGDYFITLAKLMKNPGEEIPASFLARFSPENLKEAAAFLQKAVARGQYKTFWETLVRGGQVNVAWLTGLTVMAQFASAAQKIVKPEEWIKDSVKPEAYCSNPKNVKYIRELYMFTQNLLKLTPLHNSPDPSLYSGGIALGANKQSGDTGVPDASHAGARH